MELGLAPIVVAAVIMHLLTGTKIIDCNFGSKADRELLQSAQKAIGIAVTLIQALAFLFCGMYGQVSELGILGSILIVLQLLMAGIIVLLLDELLQKGYGLGSGTSLFIATNICSIILWQCFSPRSVASEEGPEYEGCVIALFHFLLTKPNKLNALYEAFFRTYAPNMLNLIATLLVGLLVNVFQVSISWKSVE